MDAGNKRSYYLYLPVAIIAVAIIIVFILLITKPKPATTALVEQVWPVTVEKAVYGTYTPNLVLYGTVESPQVSTLRASQEADVTGVFVKGGQTVKKGQLLLTLDDREATLTLTRKQAHVAEMQAMIAAQKQQYKSDKTMLKHEQTLINIMQKDVERRATLFKKRVGSAAQLDKAREELNRQRVTFTNRQLSVDNFANKLKRLEAQLAMAKADADDAKIDLEHTKLYAPFNGRVVNVYVAVGYRVTVGSNLIRLFDLSDVEIRAQIPTAYVAKARIALENDELVAASGKLDGQSVQLTLVRLAGEVMSGRGGVDGLFRVDSTESHLALGRAVKLTVDLVPQENVISIPEQALYGNDRIYIVKDQRMQPVTVQRVGTITKADGNKRVLIKGNIANGDLIITTHIPQAIAGLKVAISNNNNENKHVPSTQ